MKSIQGNFNSYKAFKGYAPRFEHGGGVRKGKRKLARPFSPNKALHVTIRSSRARGKWSFLRPSNEKKIQKVIYLHSEKCGIKLYRFANSGNHLHFLLKANDKKAFQKFLRIISGLIPRIITGSKKGSPYGKFWDSLAHSKVLAWGRQFKSTYNYIFRNTLEAFGIIPPRHCAAGRFKIDFEKTLYELAP